ncbi:uncharacterized protein LOC118643505 [Molossus molossus]|uniref:uncharacterized protein LOC118643505 n=1 Tax=Molossus molossus TaxID=27622 RepID=UPI0017470AC4|nr:uncharacterized protein LOC118643505 [Molossus molossus]
MYPTQVRRLFPFPETGDSPVAGAGPDKAGLKRRQSTVSKQSEKERECCSGNSSGMGRDLAAVPQLENLTGAASERGLGLLTLRRPPPAQPGSLGPAPSAASGSRRDASGTVHAPPERHAQLRGAAGVQSGDLRLAEKMPVFLCPAPDDFNTGELGHDHLDSQSHELHNRNLCSVQSLTFLLNTENTAEIATPGGYFKQDAKLIKQADLMQHQTVQKVWPNGIYVVWYLHAVIYLNGMIYRDTICDLMRSEEVAESIDDE